MPTDLSLGKKTNHSVSVGVTGGQKTNPLWTSQVANEDFKAALETTIRRSGLFSQVLEGGSGQYQLDVRLVQLRQPMMGFNMTVEAQTDWRLRETSSGRVIWEEHVNKAFTATVGDAFAGVKRLRLANEGAIRENIKAGLGRIAALPL